MWIKLWILFLCLDTKCIQWPLSTEIHGYLSQSMFATSKTLCNFSNCCPHLDTLFKTVNFQFKTGQHFDHDGKRLNFDRQMKLYTWNKTDYSIIFAFSFLLCCVCLQPCYQLYNTTIQKSCSTAFALKFACMKEKYRCS